MPTVATLWLSNVPSDGRTDLFCQAKILDSTGSLSQTVSLPHTLLGVYAANVNFTAYGTYTAVYHLYTDSGFTTDAGYNLSSENLDVSSFKTDISRLLGLSHENTVVDKQTFDGSNNLLTARIRTYTNAVDAAAAYAISPTNYTTNLLFEYSVVASYSAGLLSNYAIYRVT